MYFFRADANIQIASGHIMRCIAIAQKLIEVGGNVKFLIADKYPIGMLDEYGIDYTVLYSQWDDLMSEVPLMVEILKEEKDALLIIDTYSVSKEYIESILPFAKVCYIGSKQEYLGELNALINYSSDIDFELYRKNYGRNTTMMLGVSYAPLRKEFIEISHLEKDKEKFHILLTTGNSDRELYIPSILQGLVNSPYFNKVVVEVIVGNMFNNKKSLNAQYGNLHNIHLYENVKSISSLMQKCHLAISANGTTVYELAAAKIPMITFAMVEEQFKSAKKLSEIGAVDYCGEIYKDRIKVIESIIEKTNSYVCNPTQLHVMADRANQMIDGHGCDRIVNTLLNLS